VLLFKKVQRFRDQRWPSRKKSDWGATLPLSGKGFRRRRR